MRAILLGITLSLTFPAAALAAEAGKPAAAAQPEAAPAPTNADCLQCHEVQKAGEADGAGKAGVMASLYGASVHKDLSCTDCHQGYGAPGPHELPALTDAAEQKLADGLARGKTLDGKPAVGAPRAYLACGTCHADALADWQASAHGRWLGKEQAAAGATCQACHGSPHEVTPDPDKKDAAAFRAYQVKLSGRCQACHADEKFTKAVGIKDDVAVNWKDSIHGRLVALGSARAPLCTDCHANAVAKSGHKSIAGGKVQESAVFAAEPPAPGDARIATCGQCHKASNPNFAGLIAHKQLQDTGKVPHLVHIAFSYLTTLTLLFFAFHVLVDFIFELRRRLQRRKEHHHDPHADEVVVRFDIHQRIQHWLMLAGVILLGLTGWPLRGAGAGAVDMAQRISSSSKFMSLMGGPHGAGVLHRVAAVMIMISGVYHIVYLAVLAKKKMLPFSMLPLPRDAKDIKDNVLFMLGVTKERPRFERYNYLEKFDYWAVFWGMVMMIGSGFIFWYPDVISLYVPTWLVSSALIVHGEEATLAILFLFVVHFYNVHLKPSIFPMNWAWLTGQVTVEYMKDEHPAEYERRFGKKK